MNDDIASLESSRACHMLRAAIPAYTANNTGGLRALAARMGLSHPTILSKMANGKKPIPLDRANELADLLGLEPFDFARAVLEQRAPQVAKVLRQGYETRISEERATSQETVGTAPTLVPSAPEMALIKALRHERPDGITMAEARELSGFLASYLYAINDIDN